MYYIVKSNYLFKDIEHIMSEKSSRTLYEKIHNSIDALPLPGKLIAGGSILALSTLALTGCGESNPAVAGVDSSSTAEATPSKTAEAQAIPELDVKPSVLSVEKYPDAATLIPAFNDIRNGWINAGGSVENSKTYLSNTNPGVYLKTLVGELNPTYEQDLIDIPSLASDESLANFVTLQNQVHEVTTQLNFQTTPGNDPKDKEPYVRTNGIDSIAIESQDSNQIVADVTFVDQDNADKNRALELTNGVAITTETETLKMTWKNINGDWKLTDAE